MCIARLLHRAAVHFAAEVTLDLHYGGNKMHPLSTLHDLGVQDESVLQLFVSDGTPDVEPPANVAERAVDAWVNWCGSCDVAHIDLGTDLQGATYSGKKPLC